MKTSAKKHTTPQSLNAAIKNICDIMRRSNCAGALQYVPELTWILFLRILDEREQHEAEAAAAVGAEFTPSLEPPYRWRDWAAPGGSRSSVTVGGSPSSATQNAEGGDAVPPGWKRKELEAGALGAFFNFVNQDLIPHLKGLKDRPNATVRQKVISEIFSGIERTRIDTERNLLDVLDKVNGISTETVDPTHVFTLSQVYEGLLLKMGEKGNDGGQFFTPREVIRAMVRVIDPKI
ncbi:MAG: type I restriction-modification system subunit M N-terminal domain-containing protein, partial [candidate division KSB1 bacterium]|nr:type I restriction-modification system subunit M N-terminal domain-containing protein [candidate division KSB1 bacterium]